MATKKIFILLPDGVGLRNFAFSSFVERGEDLGWDVVFWNNTPFDISELGFKEVRLKGKASPLTDLLKRAKILLELKSFEKRFEDPIYRAYKFPPSRKGLKAQVKNSIVAFFVWYFKGEKGLRTLRDKLKASERKSKYYSKCRQILKSEKPVFVFSTNQRSVTAVAPLTAAQDLGIPTGTFIFSWDNLPKAKLIVDADYYFVWSEYMKNELRVYYPYIFAKKILVTGSPQFESHFKKDSLIPKNDFFNEFRLDPNYRYLCFSGDDITTSPHDQTYLEDVAKAVIKLNEQGKKIRIIFRRCPVDFSDRYDRILDRYNDVIIPIEPRWKKIGGYWNSVLPSAEDSRLQSNIIQHTFMVINLGSSMVFDYVIFGKPCAYINYNPEVEKLKKDTETVYQYVHFRSMTSKKAVLWINSQEEIEARILQVLESDYKDIVKNAEEWFQTINEYPPEMTSKRIWENLNKLEECI